MELVVATALEVNFGQSIDDHRKFDPADLHWVKSFASPDNRIGEERVRRKCDLVFPAFMGGDDWGRDIDEAELGGGGLGDIVPIPAPCWGITNREDWPPLIEAATVLNPVRSRRVTLAREYEAVRSWTGSNGEARKVRF